MSAWQFHCKNITLVIEWRLRLHWCLIKSLKISFASRKHLQMINRIYASWVIIVSEVIVSLKSIHTFFRIDCLFYWFFSLSESARFPSTALLFKSESVNICSPDALGWSILGGSNLSICSTSLETENTQTFTWFLEISKSDQLCLISFRLITALLPIHSRAHQQQLLKFTPS